MKCWEVLHTKIIDINYELHMLFNKINYLNIEEFVEALCDEIELHETNNGVFIDLIKTFHQKSKTFCEIRKQIDKIENGGYIVLMAHQPNIFPSVAIIETIFVLAIACKKATEKTGKFFIPVFMFVDYDYADDKRFLNSYVPMVTKPYKKTMKLSIDPTQKRDVMFNISKPDLNTIETWIEILDIAVNQLNYTKEFDSNFFLERIRNLISECYEKCTSFTEFNEFFLDRIVNKIWKIGIVFFEGHELYKKNEPILKVNLGRKEDINKLYNECLCILQKNNIEVTMREREISENYEWVYKRKCNRRCRKKCGNNEKEIALSCKYDYLFPDVIYDNMLDYILLHKIGSVGYYKQAEHIILSNYVYNKLWGKVTPQLLVDPTGIGFHNIGVPRNKYTVQYIKNCENRQCSIIFFLALLGFEKTKKIIENNISRRYMYETISFNYK